MAALVVVSRSWLRASRCSVAGSQVAPWWTWVPQAPQGVSQLRSRARFPSPSFSLPNCPCFRLWVEGAQRGAPLSTPPTKDSGRCGPGASPSYIPDPGSLMGCLSFSFIFLLTHQGKFGTVQSKVGARLGVHFSSGGRAHRAE